MAELADNIALEPLQSQRFTLEPLSVADASEMASILGDPSIHEFTGGAPMTPTQVRALCQRLEAGSPDPTVIWLNWVLRSRDDHTLLGTMQATVWPDQDRADVAWIVGAAWQGRGIASEAAAQVVMWLRSKGVLIVVAHIHPDHGASQGVARRIGLAPTEEVVDGEIEWRLELE